jgi:hypothetical protein
MELSPVFVDVAVRRWEKLTGKTATRVDADGVEQPGLRDEIAESELVAQDGSR